MNNSVQRLRDFLAVILVGLAAMLGWVGMFMGESNVIAGKKGVIDPVVVQQYLYSFGVVLFFAGIAFILIGFKDKTRSDLLDPTEEGWE